MRNRSNLAQQTSPLHMGPLPPLTPIRAGAVKTGCSAVPNAPPNSLAHRSGATSTARVRFDDGGNAQVAQFELSTPFATAAAASRRPLDCLGPPCAQHPECRRHICGSSGLADAGHSTCPYSCCPLCRAKRYTRRGTARPLRAGRCRRRHGRGSRALLLQQPYGGQLPLLSNGGVPTDAASAARGEATDAAAITLPNTIDHTHAIESTQGEHRAFACPAPLVLVAHCLELVLLSDRLSLKLCLIAP